MSWQDDDGSQSQVFGPVFVPGPQITGNSWDPKLPDNPMPAKAALLVAAMPFFFMALGNELDIAAEEMGWQPVYADTVDRVEPHPSQAPFFFAELSSTAPLPPVDPAEVPTWLPTYPADLPHWDRRLGMIPFGTVEGSLGAPLASAPEAFYPDLVLPLDAGTHPSAMPFHFWNPLDTPPVPVFDPVDFPWGVEYPDWIARKPFLPMGGVEGTVKQVKVVPPPVYPHSIAPLQGTHASHQLAFFMDPEPIVPVFDPSVGFPYPSYPAQVDRLTVHPSAVPYLFYDSGQQHLPIPELAWEPAYPAAVDRLESHPSGMPSVFYQGDPSDFGPQELRWEPELPTQVDRVEPHASQLPYLFFDVEPQPDVFDPQFVPRRFYPDQLPQWTPTSQAHLYPSVFFVGEPSDVPATAEEMGWQPVYPDAVDRRTVHASQLPWLAQTLDPSTFPTPGLGWLPLYPDQVDRLAVHASTQPFYYGELDPSDFPVPDLSWAPVYPDTIDPTAGTHASQQRPVFFDPLPIPTPLTPIDEQAWRPTYPDTIDRTPSMHAAPSVFFVGEPSDLVPESEFAWRPVYPSAIDRTEAHASSMPSVFQTLDPSTFPPPAGSWYPEYPDAVDRLQVQAADLDSYFAPDQSPVVPYDPAGLEWTPTYPNAIAQARVFPADVPTAFGELDPSDFPVPGLGWLPTYPDFATAQTTHPSQAPTFFMDPEPVADGVAPDFVPAVYPDVVHRIQPKGAIYIFEPTNLGTSTRVTQMPVEAVQIADVIETRITQMVMEAAEVDDTIQTRLTQMVVEIVHTGDCPTFTPSEPPPPVPEPCPLPSPPAVTTHACPPKEI